MLEAAFAGFQALLDPAVWMYVMAGVVIGSFFAAMPGVGGITALSILLPIAVSLEPYVGIGLLLSANAVSGTANAFPAVLMAVPGSAGAAPTILDGYAMSQKGQAARALGAAFTASALGGIIGGLLLIVSVPVMKPLVLSLGSPELFMLILWGLTLVGVLSSGDPIRGTLAALLGLLIATVGYDLKSGVPRFYFGQPYLYEGVSFAVIALGIFAVPEVMFLAMRRSAIAQTRRLGSGTMQGIRETFRHWWLVIRTSMIGGWMGFMPGVGSSTIGWVAYAHALQSEKNTESFGKGDIRGVIAAETGNNSQEGASLIPVVAFGIPGGAGYALHMVALIAWGFSPGPRMLTDELSIVYYQAWVVILAQVLASILCLLVAKWVAKVAFLPYTTVVPVIFGIAIIGAYASTYHVGDIVLLTVAAMIGVAMKALKWPRPPMILGLVLGAQAEQYLWLSVQRYYAGWLLRPGVILLMILIAVTAVYPLYKSVKQRKTEQVSA